VDRGRTDQAPDQYSAGLDVRAEHLPPVLAPPLDRFPELFAIGPLGAGGELRLDTLADLPSKAYNGKKDDGTT